VGTRDSLQGLKLTTCLLLHMFNSAQVQLYLHVTIFNSFSSSALVLWSIFGSWPQLPSSDLLSSLLPYF